MVACVTTIPPAAKIGWRVDFPMVAFITDSMAFAATPAINVPCIQAILLADLHIAL